MVRDSASIRNKTPVAPEPVSPAARPDGAGRYTPPELAHAACGLRTAAARCSWYRGRTSHSPVLPPFPKVLDRLPDLFTGDLGSSRRRHRNQQSGLANQLDRPAHWLDFHFSVAIRNL